MKTNSDPRSLDDLVFENRNHEYGAYVIRRSYHNNVNKATLMAIGAATVIAVLSIVPKEMVPKEITAVMEESMRILPPPPIQQIKPVQPPPQQMVKSNAKLAPVVTTQEVLPPVEIPLDPANTGQEGIVTGEPLATNLTEVIPNEIGPSFPVSEAPKIYNIAEVMPKFVGGDEAMFKFIVKKVQYPRRARSLEQEGTVFVSFVIGKDGNVLDPRVVKGFNADCDAEAVRVISKMPMWSPGKQGGMPVMVRMVIPIHFKLN